MSDQLRYGIGRNEPLYSTVSDALEGLRAWFEPDETTPRHISIYEYRRIVLSAGYLDILGYLYDSLDARYGDQFGDYRSCPSKQVQEKADELAALIVAEYAPWRYLKTGRYYLVDVDEWCWREGYSAVLYNADGTRAEGDA